LALVDRLDLTQQAQGLRGSQGVSRGQEATNILGQAATAEANSSTEAVGPDPGVHPETPRQRVDVCASALTDLRHGVDEGDLGGQERVGSKLGQFSGGQV